MYHTWLALAIFEMTADTGQLRTTQFLSGQLKLWGLNKKKWFRGKTRYLSTERLNWAMSIVKHLSTIRLATGLNKDHKRNTKIFAFHELKCSRVLLCQLIQNLFSESAAKLSEHKTLNMLTWQIQLSNPMKGRVQIKDGAITHLFPRWIDFPSFWHMLY